MISIPSLLSLRRLHVGITQNDGTRVSHTLVNNGEGALIEQSAPESSPAAPPPADDDQSLEPVSVPPALVLEPVRIMDFVALLIAAQQASRALDRFVQLRDPAGVDLHALERLQQALAPFYPAPPDHGTPTKP